MINLLSIGLLINTDAITPGYCIAGWIIIGLLILFSAVVSGAEAAFFSLSPRDRQQLLEEDSRRAHKAVGLLNQPEKLTATILVTSIIFNIPAAVLGTYLSYPLFAGISSPILALLLQLLMITIMLLLLCEFIPKSIATRIPLAYALGTATVLVATYHIFKPFISSLTRTTGILRNRLQTNRKPNLSIDDLSHAIEMASDELNEEKEMLEGIINFTNIEVKAIMKPRNDITALDYDDNFEQMMAMVVDSGYSRLPVFKANNDNIVGVLYIKDLLPCLGSECHQTFEWQTLIRELLVVSESKKIKDLLKDFQRRKMHIAVVVDDYGGTSGIVTMEDILEEIVGEISDESDTDGLPYQQTGENTWEFDGRTALTDFCKVFDIDYSAFVETKGENDTLAGLILEVKGEIPLKHQQISYGDFVFTILAADNRRIKKIKVNRNESI